MIRHIAATAALICLGARSLPAQAPVRDSSTAADSAKSRWISGLTITLPSENGTTSSEFLGVGYSGLLARPNRIGPDVSVVVMPRFIAFGALLAGARLNLGLPIALGRNGFLVPSAGISAIAAAGVGGGGMSAGYNGSLALVLLDPGAAGTGADFGFRIGMSLHRFADNGAPMLRVIELGLVKR
jgi:hypothetical protein